MDGEFNAAFHVHHHQQQHGLLYNFGNCVNGAGGYELISGGGSLNLSPIDGGIQMFSPPAAAPQVSSPAGPSSTMLLDSVPGLKHDTGLAVEWSVEEQYKLEEGLAKYAREPQIMQYIKIAALLNDKTVRDVALRCQWMARKRRKQDNQNLGNKIKEQKNKLMETSLKNNTTSPSSATTYPSTTNHHHLSNYMLSGVRHLLEENNRAFCQISANLSNLKLQENIELFSRTKNNLTTILNDMGSMPGVISQMPPLPVLLNEELATSIFPNSSQHTVYGSLGAIHLKQERGC